MHLRSLLPLDERLIWAQSLNNIFTDTSEAISATAAAIRDMLALAHAHDRPILFFQQPQADELDELDLSHEKLRLVGAVQKAVVSGPASVSAATSVGFDFSVMGITRRCERRSVGRQPPELVSIGFHTRGALGGIAKYQIPRL